MGRKTDVLSPVWHSTSQERVFTRDARGRRRYAFTLEGAKLTKLMGASTIALSGAGIGNVSSSLLHSAARKREMAKPVFGYAVGYAILGVALREAFF